MTDERDDFDSVFDVEPEAEMTAEVETQPEAEQEAEVVNENLDTNEPDGEPEGEGGQEKAEKDEGSKTVPIAALHEERDARKALKTEVSGLQNQLQQTQHELQKLVHFIQSQPQQQRTQGGQQEQQQFVDPLEDPQGYAQAIQRNVQQMIAPMNETIASNQIQSREQQSFFAAQAQYGPELVNEACEAVAAAGLTNRFRYDSQDPVGEAVTWYKNQQVLKEVGSDPEAYKQAIFEKAKAEAYADFQKAQGQQPAANPVSKEKIPPSLSSQTSASGVAAGESEDDFFNSIFT